jgi:hypothetical protein
VQLDSLEPVLFTGQARLDELLVDIMMDGGAVSQDSLPCLSQELVDRQVEVFSSDVPQTLVQHPPHLHGPGILPHEDMLDPAPIKGILALDMLPCRFPHSGKLLKDPGAGTYDAVNPFVRVDDCDAVLVGS